MSSVKKNAIPRATSCVSPRAGSAVKGVRVPLAHLRIDNDGEFNIPCNIIHRAYIYAYMYVCACPGCMHAVRYTYMHDIYICMHACICEHVRTAAWPGINSL